MRVQNSLNEHSFRVMTFYNKSSDRCIKFQNSLKALNFVWERKIAMGYTELYFVSNP